MRKGGASLDNLDFGQGACRVLQIRLVEGNMAKTAVGLFENPGSFDEVVRDLVASGFSQNDVRVLGEPEEMAGSGLMSIPHTDFEMDLIRELRTIGAAEADAEAYVEGVRRGGVIVFATGSGEKADAAVEIMNRHRAVEIEELSAPEPHLPGTHRDDQLARGRKSSVQVGRFRSPGGGARMFAW
jgi:hypothetical protein